GRRLLMKMPVTKTIAAEAAEVGDTASSIQGVRLQKSLTIHKSAEELYSLWRPFEQAPRFMSHVNAVELLDAKRSRWHVKGPNDVPITYLAELVDDIPNELISWRSVEEADIANVGSVVFRPAPGRRGTLVTVSITYDPPGGALGDKIATL